MKIIFYFSLAILVINGTYLKTACKEFRTPHCYRSCNTARLDFFRKKLVSSRTLEEMEGTNRKQYRCSKLKYINCIKELNSKHNIIWYMLCSK